MFKNRIDDRSITEAEKLQGLTGENTLPPRLFNHPDIFQAVDSAPLVEKKGLINTIHYIHFTNGTIMVHASEPRYGEDFIFKAYVEACPPGEIVCRLTEGLPPLTAGVTIPHVIVSDGLSLILLPIRVTALHDKLFS